MISNLVELSDYEINGNCKTVVKKNSDQSNCYTFVNQLLDKWADGVGDRPVEINQLIRRLVPYWGFDLNMTGTLWKHWMSRLDKGVEGMNNIPVTIQQFLYFTEK